VKACVDAGSLCWICPDMWNSASAGINAAKAGSRRHPDEENLDGTRG